jgi:hypothetical protein
VSITGKTRSFARGSLKLQRRIAIAEALFWPVLLGTGVVIGMVVLVTRRLGRRPTPASGHVDSTAGPTPIRD